MAFMETGSDKKIRQTAAVVAGISSFVTPFMGSSINIALPSIGRELSIDAVLLSWVATLYLLSSGMFLVPFGRIADIYGKKRILKIGMTFYSITSLICAVAPSAIVLLFGRFLQGIGASMIFSTAVAMLTAVYPAEERGKALGLNTAMVYTGLSLGPVLGGIMTQYWGWRSIFFANAFLGLVVVIIVVTSLKGEWAEARGEKFDLLGSIFYSLMLVAGMYGFTSIPSAKGLLLLGLGILSFFLFVLLETRAKDPIMEMSLFKQNTVFAFSNLAAFINYSATFAVGFLMSLYLQSVRSYNPRDAGMIIVTQAVIMAFFSPLAGRLSDRFESRVVASIGMAFTVVGLALLATLGAETPIGFIYASLALLGFGVALFSSPNTNAVMSSVDKRQYGVASATLATMRLVGQLFSMAVASLVLRLFLGEVQITDETKFDFVFASRISFTIFSILCFGGVFASLARGKMRKSI